MIVGSVSKLTLDAKTFFVNALKMLIKDVRGHERLCECWWGGGGGYEIVVEAVGVL
jgi:hypothetical protein